MWCDMDHKEIIDYLDGIEKFICYSACDYAMDPASKNCKGCRDRIAISFAKKAVKKQIGMKTKSIRIDGFYGHRCQSCKKQVWIDDLYCSNCGQRLEWEHEEGSE